MEVYGGCLEIRGSQIILCCVVSIWFVVTEHYVRDCLLYLSHCPTRLRPNQKLDLLPYDSGLGRAADDRVDFSIYDLKRHRGCGALKTLLARISKIPIIIIIIIIHRLRYRS
jgi:hypothetical protein